MTAMVYSGNVVVLNNDGWTELGRMPWKKAVRLLSLGKAVVHEVDSDDTTERLREWIYLKSIRMVYFVKVNYKTLYAPAPFTKHGVRLRDQNKCAYCGRKATTIDHVLPRSRGGENSWMNCVASCFDCNNKKDNKTPKEAGMNLQFQPFTPTRAQLLGR